MKMDELRALEKRTVKEDDMLETLLIINEAVQRGN